MSSDQRKVLFLCTGNSARSIMAEALMNDLSNGRFRAYSAGPRPLGEVHPLALETLKYFKIPSNGFRSKSWSEFVEPRAPRLDFVLTVCDKAAGESCPTWPGQPITAHWGVFDPSTVRGDADLQAKAFIEVAVTLRRRIQLMLALPIENLDALSMRRSLRDIGREE